MPTLEDMYDIAKELNGLGNSSNSCKCRICRTYEFDPVLAAFSDLLLPAKTRRAQQDHGFAAQWPGPAEGWVNQPHDELQYVG